MAFQRRVFLAGRRGGKKTARDNDQLLDFLGNSGPHVHKVPIPQDRGSRRGAKRCIVTPDLALIDHHTAKAAGLKGEFFQSRKEAKHYIYLEINRRGGRLRPLPGQDRWRQVNFPLYAMNPEGLKVKICVLRLDFAYETVGGSVNGENVWIRRYEDVKPGGGLREDTYLLKRKWFEAQYGITITEL